MTRGFSIWLWRRNRMRVWLSSFRVLRLINAGERSGLIGMEILSSTRCKLCLWINCYIQFRLFLDGFIANTYQGNILSPATGGPVIKLDGPGGMMLKSFPLSKMARYPNVFTRSTVLSSSSQYRPAKNTTVEPDLFIPFIDFSILAF